MNENLIERKETREEEAEDDDDEHTWELYFWAELVNKYQSLYSM